MAVSLLKIVIDDTYGASFIGVLIAAMLYGITTLQTYFFYIYYPNDRMQNKILVGTIWTLDTLHMVLISLAMYHYLISNYANPLALFTGHWSLFTSVGALIALIVHCFFTARIFQLSSSKIRWWLTSIIGLLVVGHFCFGIETVTFLFIKKLLTKLPEITLFAALPLALFAVLSDIFIAAALCILLHGSRTSFRRTNTIVNTLMVYAINRCVLTSVVAVAEIIVFAVSPRNLWFLAIDFVVGKLYANSLLATLNSRHSIGAAGSTVDSIHLSEIGFGEQSPRRNDTTQREVVIHLRAGGSLARASGSQGTQQDDNDKLDGRLQQ